jgi:uncharacterized OsmC-like protein
MFEIKLADTYLHVTGLKNVTVTKITKYFFLFISLAGCYNLSARHSAAEMSVVAITCRGSVQRRIPY